MAHWTECAVTDSGTELLNEWMAGRKITLSSVRGGTGLVDESALTAQTGLTDQRQTLSLIDQTDGEGGKNVQIQISNQNLEAEYVLNQIGVYARLDADQDPDGPETLLFLMQDRQGVTIPAGADESFLMDLYCLIGITNNGRFSITVDAMGIVTMAYLKERLEREFRQHNESREAHPDLRDHIAEVDARLALLELLCGTDVRGNPFTVGFGDLETLEAQGVWNVPQKRIEF